MREIGGFFELELSKKREYHLNAEKLNTGRNCLEYILRAKNYQKIYIPYYMCTSILEPIKKLGINYEYYNIDSNFNIKMDLFKIQKNELLFYVNYFGVCNKQVEKVLNTKNELGFDLCIDNTQAFFNFPGDENYTIYSVRKFFGVPDGAYLYTAIKLNSNFDRELGYDKVLHLNKRLELGATNSYVDFKKSSVFYKNQPIKKMSILSECILKSIDYQEVIKKRINNFMYLHQQLGSNNELKFEIEDITCPMVYPLMVNHKSNIKDFLISYGIFIPTYWPGISDMIPKFSEEWNLVNNLLPLPIDQRYGLEDMNYIVNCIKEYIRLNKEGDKYGETNSIN